MTKHMFVTTAILAIALSAPAQVLLEADFDDKPIDQPIGTGGAAVGEPINVGSSITAIVRDTPMATPSLEIADSSQTSAGAARFELLDGAEVSSGWLRISMQAYLPDLESDFVIMIRESGSSAYAFADVDFAQDGQIWGSDAAGGTGALGPYLPNTLQAVELLFDLEGHTWDLYVNGILLLDQRDHGITTAGIGAVLVGCGWDSDEIGTGYVDNLLVERMVFYDGFESGDTAAWSAP